MANSMVASDRAEVQAPKKPNSACTTAGGIRFRLFTGASPSGEAFMSMVPVASPAQPVPTPVRATRNWEDMPAKIFVMDQVVESVPRGATRSKGVDGVRSRKPSSRSACNALSSISCHAQHAAKHIRRAGHCCTLWRRRGVGSAAASALLSHWDRGTCSSPRRCINRSIH